MSLATLRGITISNGRQSPPGLLSAILDWWLNMAGKNHYRAFGVRWREWNALTLGTLAVVALFFWGNAILLLARSSDDAITQFGDPLGVDPLTAELGVVQQGDMATAEFTLVNLSDSAISKLSLVPSCGCTSVRQVPDHVAPRESVKVVLEVDSRGVRGKQSVNALLQYQIAGRNYSRMISAKGTVLPVLSIDPKSIHFHNASDSTGDELSKVVTVTAPVGVDFSIKRLVTTHPAIHVEEVPESSQIGTGAETTRTLAVSLLEDNLDALILPNGDVVQKGVVELTTTVATEGAIKVPVTWE